MSSKNFQHSITTICLQNIQNNTFLQSFNESNSNFADKNVQKQTAAFLLEFINTCNNSLEFTTLMVNLDTNSSLALQMSNNNVASTIYQKFQVSTDSSAASSGDPYVRPLGKHNVLYKIPGICSNYRLFSLDDIFLNASVSGLCNKEKKALIYDTGRFTDGHYFDNFYIQCGDEIIIYDRYIKLIKHINPNGQRMKINTNDMSFYDMDCPIQGKQKYQKIDIVIDNNIKIELQKFRSVEVLNGVKVTVLSDIYLILHKIGGILNSTAHPKHFRIKPKKQKNVYIEQPQNLSNVMYNRHLSEHSNFDKYLFNV